ncbi:MAG: hypothetical protein ACOWWR_12385 [Eubacteriales bacterium]
MDKHGNKQEYIEHLHNHAENCNCGKCSSDSRIKIVLHEGAISVSFTRETQLSEEVISEILSESMLHLCIWIKESGGIIGHIKAAITDSNGTKMFSITKDIVNYKNTGMKIKPPIKVFFTGIVFNMQIEEIKLKLKEVYEKM